MCVFVVSSHLLTFNYIFFVAILFCCFLFSCIFCVCSSGSLMSNSLWPHGLYHTRLLCPRGFSRQKYWSGLPFPAPGDLSNPGTEPASLCVLHWEMCSLPLASPGKPLYMLTPPLHLWNSSAELWEAVPQAIALSKVPNKTHFPLLRSVFFFTWDNTYSKLILRMRWIQH